MKIYQAPNLLSRDFYASASDTKYVGDITYISIGEGWLYLATVIDLYSRKVVGWSMDDTMKVSLVNNALNMAMTHRKPSKGLLWQASFSSKRRPVNYKLKYLKSIFFIVKHFSNYQIDIINQFLG